MFERYLRRPSAWSVGFLVLDKLNSNSRSTVNRAGLQPNRNNSSSKYEGSNRKNISPVLSSAKYEFRTNNEDGESFAVSLLHTTFEHDNQSQKDIIQLRNKKFDTLSTDQASFDAIPNRSLLAFSGTNAKQSETKNNMNSISK